MKDRSSCEPWIDEDDLAECCTEFAANSGEGADEAIEAASSILAILSGWSVYGICTATVRPEGAIPLPGCLEGIMLQWPVRSVTQVIQDGVVLDPSTYAIMDDLYLIRLTDPTTMRNDGWVCRQDLSLPSTEIGTLEVTYSFGTDVPSWAKAAAAELACEIFRECAADECALPATLRSMNVGGTSYAFDDAAEEIRDHVIEGRFKRVQRFLAIVNPTGVRVPSDVWSPDIPALHVIRAPIDPQTPPDESTGPGILNFFVTHGDSFRRELRFTDVDNVPIDYSAATWEAQLRERPTLPGAPDAEFTIDTTDAATGLIVLELTISDTTALLPGHQYHWDLERTIGTDRLTMLEGVVTVRQDVSV